MWIYPVAISELIIIKLLHCESLVIQKRHKMNNDKREDIKEVKAEEISEKERERIELAMKMNKEKMDKIYNKIRSRITKWIEKSNLPYVSNIAEYVLALPDFFVLLWRLMRDERVTTNKKIFIAGMIAYVISPIDIIPDFIPVFGYLDDLVIIAIGLNSIFNETEYRILLDNWSGNGDVLSEIQKIIGIGHQFLSKRVMMEINNWTKRRHRRQ